jgi:hypothetical protein
MGVETQGIVVTLLGGLLISITVSGRFTSYVRPGFKWLLLVAGAILVIVGIVSVLLAVRADRAPTPAGPGAPTARRKDSPRQARRRAGRCR